MATTETINPLYPRKRAMAAGFKVYTTDSPCQHCQTHARYTASGACIECDRRKKAARLEDPETAARIRAQGAARIAKWRDRKKGSKPAARVVDGGDEFGDILG